MTTENSAAQFMLQQTDLVRLYVLLLAMPVRSAGISIVVLRTYPESESVEIVSGRFDMSVN